MTDDLGKAGVEILELLVDVTRAEEFLQRLTPEVTWTIPGDWPGISGVKDRRQIETFMRKVFPAGFPTGLTADVDRVLRDGHTVVIEFLGRAVTSKQRVYENRYCFIFEFAGDRVHRIREYMDTLYANAILHT